MESLQAVNYDYYFFRSPGNKNIYVIHTILMVPCQSFLSNSLFQRTCPQLLLSSADLFVISFCLLTFMFSQSHGENLSLIVLTPLKESEQDQIAPLNCSVIKICILSRFLSHCNILYLLLRALLPHFENLLTHGKDLFLIIKVWHYTFEADWFSGQSLRSRNQESTQETTFYGIRGCLTL